ncbi:MAG: PQQ-like beta-propeller repeat protein [Opitutaceae bacterium]|nr:PQQ-like beta-propeller repeat protein [Opitutaceae bacterium]
METNSATAPARRPLRLWPAMVIGLLAAAAVAWVRWREGLSFQQRNMQTIGVALGTFVLLLLWWILASRAPRRLRVGATLATLVVVAAGAGLFRVRGVSGDLVPILEFRWGNARRYPSPGADATQPTPPREVVSGRADFPQFLGPERTGVLAGPALEPDWAARPPRELWRIAVGAGWSGFAIAGSRAVTQEQRGTQECVTCYDLATGKLLWKHEDATRYATPIGGEGPRATPTIAGGTVFTLGATGRLNALDLATGARRWTHDLPVETGATMPEWGYSGSPLVLDGRVVVSAGGPGGKSLLAFRAEDGERVWSAGEAEAGYSAPFVATLAGRRQILAFNHRRISAHDAGDGALLWEHPMGRGYPHVAVPVIAGPDRVMFSAGYGVGTELLEIKPAPGGAGGFAAERVWHSLKLKAKFANPFARDGFLYGLDDGILTCLDLRDGAVKWKEGRYGHGQTLLVGDLLLLTAENGELVLLRPTLEVPNELRRHRVFSSKTWNPPALAGDLLLMRNDLEAVALRLPLAGR